MSGMILDVCIGLKKPVGMPLLNMHLSYFCYCTPEKCHFDLHVLHTCFTYTLLKSNQVCKRFTPSFHPTSKYSITAILYLHALANLPYHAFNWYQTQRLGFWLRSAKDVISLPHRHPLYWLPVKFRIEFKILLITFKALSSLAPHFITDLLLACIPTRLRWSFDLSF